MMNMLIVRSFAGAALAVLVGAITAAAEEPAAPPAQQLNLSAPATALPEGVALDVNVRDGNGRRFASLDSGEENQRGLELEIAAGSGPIDVSIASRASLEPDANGDLTRRGRGSEVRVGRGLTGGGGEDSTYVFVASDNEALTWQPGARSEFGGRSSALALQGDRVEVGDLSAGITVERDGVQASLAYVERSESTQVGNQGFSQDQSFTGVTVTVRH